MSHAEERHLDVPSPFASVPLYEASQRQVPLGQFRELVTHLARRQLEAKHQLTLLGWFWPLARQLAQLAVLVFVFSQVFNSNIQDFPVFVFVGLISWTWFSAGMADAALSITGQRHFVLQSRLPTAVVPLVSVAVPLVDVLIAFPVLLLMLVLADELRWTLLLVPLLLPVQALLMAGLAWLASAGAVFFRDVPNLVYLGLTLAFYMTPVFYGTSTVPEKYAWIVKLNPMATIIEEYRALLLGDPAPSALRLAAVAVGSALLAVVGYLVFRRLRPRFADFL
jgi:lipopolysaccharide transport system permease protein